MIHVERTPRTAIGSSHHRASWFSAMIHVEHAPGRRSDRGRPRRTKSGAGSRRQRSASPGRLADHEQAAVGQDRRRRLERPPSGGRSPGDHGVDRVAEQHGGVPATSDVTHRHPSASPRRVDERGGGGRCASPGDRRARRRGRRGARRSPGRGRRRRCRDRRPCRTTSVRAATNGSLCSMTSAIGAATEHAEPLRLASASLSGCVRCCRT